VCTPRQPKPRQPKPKKIVIRCTTLRAGLAALLEAFPDGHE
jgi:hypothetical protein